MIPPEIQSEILDRLQKTEQEENVRILMAIESGSRAWGFASPNSDYDVRFIYSREKDWYASVDLEEKRDVIEYPIIDEIDLNGWDVRKALRLFWKSNPGFVEWIQSPITYKNSGIFRDSAINLLSEVYSVDKGIYHYRSMAKNNYRGYLRSELVPLKKYFYVLRPLLAIRWLEDKKCAAPIEFHKLLEFVNDQKVLDSIKILLKEKKRQKEKAVAPSIPVLNEFIESELDRLETVKSIQPKRTIQINKLNKLFHHVLEEDWLTQQR